MKSLLIIFFFAIGIMALDDLSVPNAFVDSAVIEADDFNENADTIEAWSEQTNDTLDANFVRHTDINGDSTFNRIQVDSIRSNPDVDSIAINYGVMDTFDLGYGTLDTITSFVRLINNTYIGNPSNNTYIYINNADSSHYIKSTSSTVEMASSNRFDVIGTNRISFMHAAGDTVMTLHDNAVYIDKAVYTTSTARVTVASGNQFNIYYDATYGAQYTTESDGDIKITSNTNKVGIGGSPTEALDVTGNIKLSGDLDVNGNDIDLGDAGGFSGFKFNATTTTLDLYMDGAAVGYFSNDGSYTTGTP